jgi:hypothetical protein
MAPHARMNPILERDRTMKISQPPSARQTDDTRTSMAFRVLIAVATCLPIVVGFTSAQNRDAANPLLWSAALLVGGCVFVLADILLAFLVVCIPPGLFVLALVALLMH